MALLNLPFLKLPGISASLKLPSISASKDYLKQLRFHIANFFDLESKDAALFLFLIWMDCFGRKFDYDLARGLKQFQRDVGGETKIKKRKGRPPSGVVAFALQRREDKDEPSYEQISKEWHEKRGEMEKWKKMGAVNRRKYANRLINNCGKQKKDPEKL
jgi:hypothetical protein